MRRMGRSRKGASVPKAVRGAAPLPSAGVPQPRRLNLRAVAAVLLLTLAAGGGAWWLAGRGGRGTSPAGFDLGQLPSGVRQQDLNVLVITLDTTRWDRLGAYGDPIAHTPNLDRLAAEGVLFEEAITSAPLTLPAHSTLFTGLLPPRHGVRDNGGYVLDPKHTTLASLLKNGGW